MQQKEKISSLAKSLLNRIMRGISVKEFGESDVCKYYTDLPIPEPLENQVELLMNLYLY